MTHPMHFLGDESGAVTIDWVALTAGVLLVGIMVVYAIYNNGVSTLVSAINATDPGFGNSSINLTVENLNAG